jgi:hypothetical protein
MTAAYRHFRTMFRPELSLVGAARDTGKGAPKEFQLVLLTSRSRTCAIKLRLVSLEDAGDTSGYAGSWRHFFPSRLVEGPARRRRRLSLLGVAVPEGVRFAPILEVPG